MKNDLVLQVKKFISENTHENNVKIMHDYQKQDQAERNSYAAFVKKEANGDWELGAKLYAAKHNRSENDIFGEKERINKFINLKFNFDEFNEKDWEAYFTLAQHCDRYPKFQKKALDIVNRYLGKNNKYYKYLYDRISCNATGMQKYKTQTICQKMSNKKFAK